MNELFNAISRGVARRFGGLKAQKVAISPKTEALERLAHRGYSEALASLIVHGLSDGNSNGESRLHFAERVRIEKVEEYPWQGKNQQSGSVRL